jgi:tetratricopeptide (TPR) repeat protein
MTTSSERLLADAVDAVASGDLPGAAAAFERAAGILASDRDATSALVSAARLRITLEELDAAAALIARALPRARAAGVEIEVLRVRAELADRRGDPEARRAAWELVRDHGDAGQRVFALTQLGGIAQATGDAPAAARQFEAALAVAGPAADPLLRAELRLELAISLTAAGEHARAGAELDAISSSLPGDDQGLRARVIGQRGVLALAQGDRGAALRLAEEARAAAVSRDDIVTYLGASSLIAMVHEAEERLVDAFDTYIRARESLVDLLGEQGRGLVQPAIDLFEQRLGPERFRAVWDGWVARRKK